MPAAAPKTMDFRAFLDASPAVIMPGAMGTELQRRGYHTTLPLWSARANLDALDLVTAIHAEYFAAGADIAVTNSFRTTPRTFAKVGGSAADAHDALRRSVDAARAAQSAAPGRPTFVAGSFAPLEDCYEPSLVPDAVALAREHGQLADWLAAAAVDFLLPETINALPEAIAMAKAASATGLPFLISFVTGADGCLLDGTPMAQAVAATDLPGRLGVMVNCRPAPVLDHALGALAGLDCGATGAYPNGAGHPHDEEGWIFDTGEDAATMLTATLLDWRARGARILGGCCGTTPDSIRALTAALGMKRAA